MEDKSLNPSNRLVKGDYFSNTRPIYFIDVDTNEKLGLLGIPHEISYDPAVTWATIKPFGKNTPNYHYTGAEDTVTLEISWYSMEGNRTDVISRCKWLEAMSKADGDLGRPHILRLMWGDLFRKALWIVKHAPYQMGTFEPSRGYLPCNAKQQVTLGRYNPLNATSELIADWRY